MPPGRRWRRSTALYYAVWGICPCWLLSGQNSDSWLHLSISATKLYQLTSAIPAGVWYLLWSNIPQSELRPTLLGQQFVLKAWNWVEISFSQPLSCSALKAQHGWLHWHLEKVGSSSVQQTEESLCDWFSPHILCCIPDLFQQLPQQYCNKQTDVKAGHMLKHPHFLFRPCWILHRSTYPLISTYPIGQAY